MDERTDPSRPASQGVSASSAKDEKPAPDAPSFGAFLMSAPFNDDDLPSRDRLREPDGLKGVVDAAVAREIRPGAAASVLPEVLDRAQAGEASIVTQPDKPAVLVVALDQLAAAARVPTFAELLLSSPLTDEDLYERDRSPPRDPGL